MVKMPDESTIQEMIKLKEDINSAKDILQNENFVKNLTGCVINFNLENEIFGETIFDKFLCENF